MTETRTVEGDQITDPATGESAPIESEQPTQEQDDSEAIAKILERHDSPESMAKSLLESTRKISAQGAELQALKSKGEGSDPGEADPGEGEGGEGEGKETGAEAAAQLNSEALSAISLDFAANGKLSDDSLASLKKVGLDEAAANEVASALFEKSLASALKDAGVTPDQYNAAADWAAENWSDEQEAKHARYLASSDPDIRAMAIERLVKAAGTQAKPGNSKPVHVEGSGSGGDTVTPFKSVDELVAARNDPRFQTDPAYRKKVMLRSVGLGRTA